MSINENKRNNEPAERQIEAADERSVCGLNALLAAETRAHRHVGYKNSVSRFHMLTMSKCNALSNSLKDRTYQPKKGEMHEVFEPKYRMTISSKYCDRVPQSSFVINYFYPKVVSQLIPHNCACMKNKGVDYARNEFKKMLRNASYDDYCLKADMKSYFASIRHDKLTEELGEFITDDFAMWFFLKTVDNTNKPTGLDLGSEVYQLSATSFLNKLDHAIGNEQYIRYQDDLVFIGTHEQCLQILSMIEQETERLNLTISRKKTYIQSVSRPIHFLGFSFWKHETGKITVKRLPQKIRNERRKLRHMVNKNVPIENVKIHYQSVRACLKYGARADLTKMDNYINKLFGGIKNG